MTGWAMIVGPFPPPVHGFSQITSELANHVESMRPVRRVDLSSTDTSRLWRHFRQAGKNLRALAAVLRAPSRGCGLVAIGCNGGLGLVYTLTLVVAARAAGLKTTLHHHSYGYILRPSRLMRWICGIGGAGLTHVFLAGSMKDAFAVTYGEPANARILPNAMFVPVVPAPERRPAASGARRLKVGMISNLTAEKGLHDFVAVARRLRAETLPVDAVLAGPIALESDRQAVLSAESEGVLTWLGPLYGAEKAKFLGGLDLFLFPTHYRFEAQPTVIYEAFANAVPVVANRRGCIAEQVGDCLLALEEPKDFVETAVAACRRLLAMADGDRLELGRLARNRHAADSLLGLRTLETLFADAACIGEAGQGDTGGPGQSAAKGLATPLPQNSAETMSRRTGT